MVFDSWGQETARQNESFKDVFTPSGLVWEYCALRTNINEQNPRLVVYRTDGAVEIPILRNEDHGDTTRVEAFNRAIAMLGNAGWELISDTYVSSRILGTNRRDLLFKRLR